MPSFSAQTLKFFQRKISAGVCLFALSLGAALPLRANHGDDLATIHCQVLGGYARIDALTSLKAKGSVSIEGRTLQMAVTAKVPNLVKTEILSGEYHIIQAYDGKNQPWQANDALSHPIATALEGNAAVEFVADADFNDPLVHPEKRGIQLEYLGKVSDEGRDYERVRIVRRGAEEQELWLDSKTYFLSRQIKLRRVSPTRVVRIETRFSDFRPVDGVIMPHRSESFADGKKLHQTVYAEVIANPPVTDADFNQEAYLAAKKQSLK